MRVRRAKRSWEMFPSGSPSVTFLIILLTAASTSSIRVNMTDEEAVMDRTDGDLDLAVELINTHWVLASPPDRLTDVGVYQRILRDAGETTLARELTGTDLGELRALREQLRPVFAAHTTEAAAGAVDEMLRDAVLPARLASGAGTAPWDCVYVDRSRARTRRYCCDQCNDRAAAAAYRRRHTHRSAS